MALPTSLGWTIEKLVIIISFTTFNDLNNVNNRGGFEQLALKNIKHRSQYQNSEMSHAESNKVAQQWFEAQTRQQCTEAWVFDH